MPANFTEEQQKAIFTKGELLVSASAGSGKTAVLVERILQHLYQGVDLDRLLVVTFTEAAANEMRERIHSALSALLEQKPEDDQLQRQILLLNKAQISTIHSFCLYVLRSGFHLIQLDPGFKIADENENKLLKNEILEEVFLEEYSDRNQDFFNLVEAYGDPTKDESLKRLLLRIFDFIRSSASPRAWLSEKVERFFSEDAWHSLYLREIRRELLAIREANRQAIALAMAAEGPFKYLPALESDRSLIEGLLAVSDLAELYRGLSTVSFERLPSYRGEVLYKEEVQTLRNKGVKDPLKNLLKAFFPKPLDLLLEDVRAFYPFLNALEKLLVKFMDRLEQAKSEKNILDFNDMEHLCLDILTGKRRDEISAHARLLREKFVEVMVDEYQDSNLSQELILSAVSNNNRFMVGDVKQSIYKFRLARPEIFLSKYQNPNHAKVILTQNFRSRASVLEGINFFFRRLMSEEIGGLCYDESVCLYPKKEFPPEPLACSNEVEVLVYETKVLEETDDEELSLPEEFQFIQELSKAHYEAEMIVKRIQGLFENDTHIFENGDYRPIRYGDIVILVRSVFSVEEAFMEVFARSGIPLFISSSRGFYQSLEVSTLLSFLQLIDNPRQDIHLIAVLHSFAYGLTPEDLMEIRLLCDGCYYEALQKYVQEYEALGLEHEALRNKLLYFLQQLHSWRDCSAMVPISQLINQVISDCGYMGYLAMLPDGAQRQANLYALIESAQNYEESSFKGLFHFIRYIEKLKNQDADQGDAKLQSENENLVRIMTIHKSKGLEFPVVFVSSLGKRFNTGDLKDKLILHQDLGFGPVYVDLQDRVISNTLPRIALSKAVKLEALSEEMRVLYVAMTRAKEKLILTGTVPEFGKGVSQLGETQDGPLPSFCTIKARCFMDWVLMAVQNTNQGNIRISLFSKEDFESNEKSDSVEEEADNNADNEGDSSIDMNLNTNADSGLDSISIESKPLESSALDSIPWVYPYAHAANTPGKLSISEIKRMNQGQDRESVELIRDYSSYDTPKFLTENQPPSSLQVGKAIHTVMEKIDFNFHRDYDRILSFINGLVERNFMEEREARRINIASIENFVNSALGDRIRRSNFVKREQPFTMLIPDTSEGRSSFQTGLDTHDFPENDLSGVMVSGIIDLYFEEEGALVLVDYKTDRTRDLTKIKERYRIQLSFYKSALEKGTQMPVKELIVYLLNQGEMVWYE